ncbi:hypothetical protein BYT27DRAFT_7207642 [Phlegmacium glaucopus]|nr:hypothetical protein BYT27DRAFT_7207642 [Phlegmacium glaucopus]
MPYGFYPPSYFPMPQWAGFQQPPSSQAFGAPQPNPTAPTGPVKGPKISEWLEYCDRKGENFSSLAYKFTKQENLSNWLQIGKGTADLIIQYAGEDMALVRDARIWG